MPRRREVPKRKWLPDPKYRSPSVTRFMNVLMLDGKKSVAEKSYMVRLIWLLKRPNNNLLRCLKLHFKTACLIWK